MSMSMSGWAGHLRLRPGRPVNAVHSTRREWAAHLTRGQAAHTVPARLASLYTACAGAHRLAARLAVQAAQGEAARPTAPERQQLRRDTAREHLWRMAADWSQAVAGSAPCAPPAALLAGCPLWIHNVDPAASWPALSMWLHEQVLGQSAESWWCDHASDPDDQVEHWAAAAAGRGHADWAGLVMAVRHAAQRHTGDLPLRLRPLQILGRTGMGCLPGLDAAPVEDLVRLAAEAQTRPGFVLAPTWQGAAADTGPWSRWHGSGANGLPPASAEQLLLSRWIDLLHLAGPDGAERLAAGSCSLGQGCGLAWVEMARGLLLHVAELESSPHGPMVADYRVIAPTEWNFHPQGALAVALQHTQDEAAARWLALAFDPCVRVEIETLAEPCHA
jgi:hypothetical protein